MEQTTKYKGLYMVLSVIIAIVAWSYVGNVANPVESGTVRNLPVDFVGMEALEERGLTITVGAEQMVSLRVSGKRNAFRSLSSDTVDIRVDVSNIQQPGEYTLSYGVFFNLPSNISESSLVTQERYPSNVSFTVARVSKRQIPIRGTLTGSVAEGYQAGKFTFSPTTIEVKGEEAIVNQINYALVTLNEENMEETYRGDLPYTFITFVDEPLDEASAKSLTTNTTLVRTTLPISKLKEVELEANVIYGGGATPDNTRITITPKSIAIAGAAADLESIKTVSLGDIDLSLIEEDTELTVPIVLPEGITNVSGLNEATVEIRFSNLVTANIETGNIELINAIDGYSARTVTQLCPVTIRGEKWAVESVTPAQVRLVADLSKAAAASGTQTVPVKVYVDGGNGVGAVGEYTIVVSISRK